MRTVAQDRQRQFVHCVLLGVALLITGLWWAAIVFRAEELGALPCAVALLAGAGFLVLVHVVVAVSWWLARHRAWTAELRSWLGLGRGVPELGRRLEMPADDLERFVPNYLARRIPKRGGGHRDLLVPDDPTKALQRLLLRRVLAPLRAHPVATAYERGGSIVRNARAHQGRAAVLRLDLVEFFANTRSERIARYFRRVGWNRRAAALLTRLCTWQGGLPQGAPTSPRLSNLVNLPIDASLMHYCARYGLMCTRYADDITISFPHDDGRHVRDAVQYVSRLVEHHGYRIHRGGKLNVRRRHQRQVVTGLVVNERAQLPRTVRRKLRAAAHCMEQGRPTTWTPAQLQGWLGLLRMTERGF